ncbi:hypothetical protein ONZ45_g5180 [Pleurotus djamor]|nr:hypothetical protein ONZ45_g5180 [Pleurotus djamor]
MAKGIDVQLYTEPSEKTNVPNNVADALDSDVWLAVFQEIHDYLPNSLYPFLLVSRSFYLLVRPLLYKDIRIRLPSYGSPARQSSNWPTDSAFQSLHHSLTKRGNGSLTVSLVVEDITLATIIEFDYLWIQIFRSLTKLRRLHLGTRPNGPVIVLFIPSSITFPALTHLSLRGFTFSRGDSLAFLENQRGLEFLEVDSACRAFDQPLEPGSLPCLRTFHGPSILWDGILRASPRLESLSGRLAGECPTKAGAFLMRVCVWDFWDEALLSSFLSPLSGLQYLSLPLQDSILNIIIRMSIQSLRYLQLRRDRTSPSIELRDAQALFDEFRSLAVIDVMADTLGSYGPTVSNAQRYSRTDANAQSVRIPKSLEHWQEWWEAVKDMTEEVR